MGNLESETGKEKSESMLLKLLRLLIIILGIASICYPVIILVNVIFKHEGIGELYPEIYLDLKNSLTVISLLFLLFCLLLLFMRRKVEIFRILAEEYTKTVPILLGLTLACSYLSVGYSDFSSIAEIKGKAIESLEGDIIETAYVDTANFIMGSGELVEKGINEPVVNSNHNNIKLSMTPNSTQNFLFPNDEHSWTGFTNYLNSKNNYSKGIKGGPINSRDFLLEGDLGESSNVLAYLRKDDFSKSATLRVYLLELKRQTANSCFKMNYRLAFNDGNSETRSRKFCSTTSNKGNDQLLINYYYPEKLKSMEIWVTNLDENYTNENNPIASIRASEDQSQRNYAVTQGCIEGFNEGVPAEKYKSIIGFIREGNFITNKPIEVEQGQCLTQDYKDVR